MRDAGAMTHAEYRLIVAEEQERALAERLAGFGLGVVTRRHKETGTGARASKTRQASPQNVTRATVEEAPNPKPTSPGSAHPAFGLNYANPSLYDPSGTALSSDALTAVPWTVAAWAARDMSFFADIADGNPNTYFQLDGTITTLTVVPEPGTLALVAVGVALLGGGRRRRG